MTGNEIVKSMTREKKSEALEMLFSWQENARTHCTRPQTLGHARGPHMSAEPHGPDYCRSDSLRCGH